MTEPEIFGEKIGIVANPYSSYPDKVERFTEIVQGIASDREVVLIETESPDQTDNVEKVASAMEDGMPFFMLGGDGTFHIGGNASIKSGKNVAVVPVPCGNADDASRALYGKDYFEDPENIRHLLENGVPCPLPAIRVELDGKVVYALVYTGRGLTGESAVEMNRPAYREVKESRGDAANRVTDALKVVLLLLQGQNGGYKYADENGGTNAARETLISSMHLFAREFMINVDSWGEEVVVNEFEPKGFVRTALGRLVKERYRPEFTRMVAEARLTPQALKETLARRPQTPGVRGVPFEGMSIRLLEDTPMQIDGEPYFGPKGAVLNMSVEPGAVNGLWVPGLGRQNGKTTP